MKPTLFPPSWAALGAALMLSACSERPATAPIVKPVFVSTVVPSTASQSRSFNAIVRARVESELSFRTGGKVTQRSVEVGDVVREGQVLARLDPADYALAVQAAADQVQAARVDAQQSASDEARFRRLVADGSVGAADLERQKARSDAAAARLEQAQRQLALAQNRRGYTDLTAPFSGVVTSLRVETGQVVAEGQSVLSLARAGDKEVVVDLPEDWVGRARQVEAKGSPWSDPSISMRLALRELSPQASPQGRTFRAKYMAKADARASLAELPLGSTVQLSLSLPNSGLDSVTLPASALLKGSGNPGVWALNAEGNRVVFRPVKVLGFDEASVRVTGLTLGTRVVSVGAQKLDEAVTVRAVDRAPEATSGTAPKGRS